MSVISSPPYPTRIQAEQVAGLLVQQGLPMENIFIRDEVPAYGLNLGAGVPTEAIDAMVNEHDDEVRPAGAVGGYVVEVETGGDALNERVAQEAFG
ncbi:hypothetical protein [Fimbriimonas ginsengisoli]|nr:hypothetical protein [Fimbriimonas ginsengisoli]